MMTFNVIARSEATKQSSCAPAGALENAETVATAALFVGAPRARWIASLRSQ
jgi:hypothetical protein